MDKAQDFEPQVQEPFREFSNSLQSLKIAPLRSRHQTQLKIFAESRTGIYINPGSDAVWGLKQRLLQRASLFCKPEALKERADQGA